MTTLVDASKPCFVVLSHKQDGKPRVIIYASRGLHGAKWNMQNYSSMKLELLSLKCAVTEKLANAANTTTIPETMQLGFWIEELGVTRPADKRNEQATSLPSIPRDQFAAMLYKDATLARLKYYLNLGKKPN